MDHSVDIALRGIPPSDALERFIGEEARRLDGICDRIRRCRVVAETQQREQPQGAQVAVRLIITLPGTEVVVNREHGSDIYVAVRDAFAAAGRQLKDQMRRRDIEPVSRDRAPDSRR
jgi:ribosome-associated translation inhibitor RaiA